MRRTHRTALLLSLTLAAACDVPTHSGPPRTVDRLGAWIPGPLSTIVHATESGLHYPTFEIVADTGSWRRVWNQTWAGSQPAPEPPIQDFALTSVVVFGLGDRVGSGYAVAMDSIVFYTSGPILFVTETRPDQPCPDTALTAPVHIAWMLDHPPPMDYRVATVRRPCPP